MYLYALILISCKLMVSSIVYWLGSFDSVRQCMVYVARDENIIYLMYFSCNSFHFISNLILIRFSADCEWSFWRLFSTHSCRELSVVSTSKHRKWSFFLLFTWQPINKAIIKMTTVDQRMSLIKINEPIGTHGRCLSMLLLLHTNQFCIEPSSKNVELDISSVQLPKFHDTAAQCVVQRAKQCSSLHLDLYHQ